VIISSISGFSRMELLLPYGLNVRAFLNNVFRARWIGRRGEIEWPARSPDLTPLDYFLWDYLKDRVYRTKPTRTYLSKNFNNVSGKR